MKSVQKNIVKSVLSTAREGSIVVVEKVDSGKSLRGRLAELGIYPGETLKVVRNSKRGPVLICVKDTTFMLGRGMAEKIELR